MITKGKNIQFYDWVFQGRKIQVVGEKQGGGLIFSFYINKEKLEDSEGKLVQSFINELKENQ